MSPSISLAFILSIAAANLPPPAVRETAPAPRGSPLVWHTDYGLAVRLAKQQRRQLFIYFRADQPNAACRVFESETLADPCAARLLADCVLVRLPLGATLATGISARTLLEHESLAEMHGMSGVAIIDFSQPSSRHYGYVVSQIPFQPKKYFQRHTFHGVKSLRTLLSLPPCSLTQRTMIYAVRMQHESPQSTAGRLSNSLSRAARQHARHQADIQLQGHHGWDERFAAINARLEDSLVPVEVCAESWPGENLVEAAVECVYSWRRSSGHWRAVAAPHPSYGYDIRRGANGIWYATGIFAQRRAE